MRNVPEYVLESKAYDLLWCGPCGLGFLQEKITREELSRYYAEAKSRLFEESTPDWVTGERRDSAKTEWLRQQGLLTPPGFAVDYGSGYGDFLERLLEDGWRILGIEPADLPMSPGAAPFVQKSDEALMGLPDRSVDLFTLWHCLEHLPDPRAILQEAARVLKPGGSLIIAVPNAASLSAKLFGRFWNGAVPPWHVTHWTPHALQQGTTQVGLEPVQTLRFTVALDYLSWIESATLASQSPLLGPASRFGARVLRAAFRMTRPLLMRLTSSPTLASTILHHAVQAGQPAADGRQGT